MQHFVISNSHGSLYGRCWKAVGKLSFIQLNLLHLFKRYHFTLLFTAHLGAVTGDYRLAIQTEAISLIENRPNLFYKVKVVFTNTAY